MTPDKRFLDQVLDGSIVLPCAMSTNPLAQLLDVEFLEASRDGNVLISMRLSRDYLQAGAALQGGSLVMIADFAMAFSALCTIAADRNVASVSLSTSFLRGGEPGRLFAAGTIARSGRRIIHAEAVVAPDRTMSNPVITASSSLIVI